MGMTLQDIAARLRKLFPISTQRFEIALAPSEDAIFETDEGGIRICAQFIMYECADDGTRGSIHNIKEQEVYILSAAHREDADRVAAYFTAWSRALPSLVERHFASELDTFMPSDFFFLEALTKTDARTVDEFLAQFESADVIERWQREQQDEAFLYEVECFGLAKHGKELLALRRPAIRLLVDENAEDDEPDDEDEDEDEAEEAHDRAGDLPIGASRIGGLPDLPPGEEWPRLGGVALSFLAQIRLSDLAEFPGADELPPSGLLSFFYDADYLLSYAEDGKFQRLAKYRGDARVLYFDTEPSTFVRAQAPADKPLTVFPAYAVRYERELMMPPMESPFYDLVDPDSEKDANWFMRFERIADRSAKDLEPPIHRLLGYTSELQGDPYLSVHSDATGRSEEPLERDSEAGRKALREAAHWRLLLQIDAGPDNELLTQDGGYFYFLIHQDDLAARRFEKAWGVLQCH